MWSPNDEVWSPKWENGEMRSLTFGIVTVLHLKRWRQKQHFAVGTRRRRAESSRKAVLLNEVVVLRPKSAIVFLKTGVLRLKTAIFFHQLVMFLTQKTTCK